MSVRRISPRLHRVPKVVLRRAEDIFPALNTSLTVFVPEEDFGSRQEMGHMSEQQNNYAQHQICKHLCTRSAEHPSRSEVHKKTSMRRYVSKKHLQTHHEKQALACDVCKKIFRKSSALTEHLRTHTEERPLECDAAKADPNRSEQKKGKRVPAVPQTRNHYGNDQHYFFTGPNQHRNRLCLLFPDIKPAALKRILDLYAGDFIRAVDHILCSQINSFLYGLHENNPSSAGFYRNRRSVSHPCMCKHVTPGNNNMTMVEPPFMTPAFQTSHKMPSINQTTPSSYQHPGMNNNSMPLQTPVFVQGCNVATPNQFFQNSNKLPELVPLPNCRPNALLEQTTSTRQPFAEELKQMLRPPFLYSDMPQPHSSEINGNPPNVHGQYLMQPSQMVRPNLAPATKQETEWNHLAACNCSEQPSTSTNQATHKTMAGIYAKQQPGNENEIMDYVDNIQPPISRQSHQDVDKRSVPLMHLPSCHDRETAPIQTMSTAATVLYQKGNLEDNHFKYSAANDSALATDIEVTQMRRGPSDVTSNTFPAGGSVPWQEGNGQCSCAGCKKSDNLNQTSSSGHSVLFIDTDENIEDECLLSTEA